MQATTCIKESFGQIKLRGFSQLTGDGKQCIGKEINNIGDARTGLKQNLLQKFFGTFLWDDVVQDQWSKITSIERTDPWPDVPCSEWSWITDPDPHKPKDRKGMYPINLTGLNRARN